MSVSTGVWRVLGFGAGFESALKPSKLQKKGERPEKGHFYFLHQVLVCSKPLLKRDLSVAIFGRVWGMTSSGFCCVAISP